MSLKNNEWMTIQDYLDNYKCSASKSIVKEKIAQVIWIENEHWRRGEDGEIFINHDATSWLAINNLS